MATDAPAQAPKSPEATGVEYAGRIALDDSSKQFLKFIDNPNLLDLNKFDARANLDSARLADTSGDAGRSAGRLTKPAFETGLLRQQAPTVDGTRGEGVRDVVAGKDATVHKLPKPSDESPKPNDELLKLATVRRGEGPWHSAERILSAHGNKASVDEVRSLAKAFKEIAAEGGLQHMGDLKVNHNFISNDNFGKLLTKVTNPKAKEALLRFMAK